MMTTSTLLLTAGGDGTGVIFPDDVLEKLCVKIGDSLYIAETARGFELIANRHGESMQIDRAGEIMRENKETLMNFAK